MGNRTRDLTACSAMPQTTAALYGGGGGSGRYLLLLWVFLPIINNHCDRNIPSAMGVKIIEFWYMAPCKSEYKN
jgi:hypothetical protein